MKRTYGSQGNIRPKVAWETSDLPAASPVGAKAPQSRIYGDEIEDQELNEEGRGSSQSTSQGQSQEEPSSENQPVVAAAPVLTRFQLTETGQARAQVDQLRYLIEGVSEMGGNTAQAVQESAMSLAKAFKQRQMRALVCSHHLLGEVSGLLEQAVLARSRADDSLRFVLMVAFFSLSKDDAVAAKLPAACIKSLLALLPGSLLVLEDDNCGSKKRSSRADGSSEAKAAGKASRSRQRLKLKKRLPAVLPRADVKGLACRDEHSGTVAQARLLLELTDVAAWGLVTRQVVTKQSLAMLALANVMAGGWLAGQEREDTLILEAIGRLGGLACSGADLLNEVLEKRIPAAQEDLPLQLHLLAQCLNTLEHMTFNNSEGQAAATKGHAGQQLGSTLVSCIETCRKLLQTGNLSGGMAGRVQECQLSVLRVLVNLTHHNEAGVVTVSRAGGVQALARCFLEQQHASQLQGSIDESATQGGKLEEKEAVEDGKSNPMAQREGVERAVHFAGIGGGGEVTASEQSQSQSPAHSFSFDVQVVALTAITNCVERDCRGSVASRKALAGLNRCTHCRLWDACRSGCEGRRGALLQHVARLVLLHTQSIRSLLSLSRGEEGQVEGMDDCLTQQEADGLVLSGYCCLLLGCLARHEEHRSGIVAVLPVSELVKVLHAFMALQRQAGVLTREALLPMCELVEQLEGGQVIQGELQEAAGEEPAEEQQDSQPHGLDGMDGLGSGQSTGSETLASSMEAIFASEGSDGGLDEAEADKGERSRAASHGAWSSVTGCRDSQDRTYRRKKRRTGGEVLQQLVANETAAGREEEEQPPLQQQQQQQQQAAPLQSREPKKRSQKLRLKLKGRPSTARSKQAGFQVKEASVFDDLDCDNDARNRDGASPFDWD